MSAVERRAYGLRVAKRKLRGTLTGKEVSLSDLRKQRRVPALASKAEYVSNAKAVAPISRQKLSYRANRTFGLSPNAACRISQEATSEEKCSTKRYP